MNNLSVEQKQHLRIQLESELYKRDLYMFFKAAVVILYPNVVWSFNWHFKYISNILQEEVERIIRGEEKTKDYIINLPFRSGKSILLSQIFPVWCWLKQPSMGIMQVSHSETLAIKHSHASKMLIESEWFKERFPNLTLRQDTHAKANYMTNSGGKRISFGVNSGIIGEGANIQIIDDLNSPKDSQAVTQSINEIYTDTLYSRLNNPSIDIRIILQQRISENDICGYLINKSPNKYNLICIPAKLTPDLSPLELIDNYVDDLFWYDRFTDKVLQDFQETLGSKAFSGQLMQKPQSEQGTVIKRDWYKHISKEEIQKIIVGKKLELYLDSAYTSKQKNDASGLLLTFKHNNILYIIKAWRLWLEFPDLINWLKKVVLQYNVRMISVETKASGLSIIQQLRRDGLNVSELSPKSLDKLTRVNAVTPIIEGGRVYVVDDDWTELYLSEMAAFPFSNVDDLVDCTSYALEKMGSGVRYAKG